MSNRILIVEDDSSIADTIALNLKYVGYEYMVFNDGDKAAKDLAADSTPEKVRCEMSLQQYPSPDCFLLPVCFLEIFHRVSRGIRKWKYMSADFP